MKPRPSENPTGIAEHPRVLVLGPFPPAVGGMVSAIQSILQSPLAQRCRLIPFAMTFATRPAERLPRRIARHLARAWTLWRTLRREQIDILYLHTCSRETFYRQCLDFLLAKASGVKTVWHVHGGRFDEFLWNLKGHRAKLVKWTLASADQVVLLAARWEGVIRAFAPRARTSVVENAVPLPAERDRTGIRPNRCVFVGDISEPKGLEDLLAVADDVLPDVELRLIGKRRPDPKGRLHRKLDAMRRTGKISWIGPLSPQRVREELREASLFVLPSYIEGMPMAMLEAMAEGLPVVVTNVGAVPEVVRDGKDGFVIDPGNRQALADRCRRLMKNAHLRRLMGHSARQRIRDGYDLNRMADKLHRVFTDVLRPTEGTP